MHSVLVTLGKEHYGSVLVGEDLARLRDAVKVTRRTDLMLAPEDTLVKALNDAEADIILTCWQSPKVTMKVLEACPELKLLSHTAGEVKHYVDRDVIEAGFIVTNWGVSTAHSTAEGAFAMTLAILRRYQNMPFWMRNDRLFWDIPDQSDEGLFEQRVGLHGLGAIAQEYAKLIRPFDCHVSAFSPNCPDEIFEQLGIVRVDSLEKLYSTNRIISCHASLRPDTHGLVGAKLLGMIEDGGYFINTSRGAVVDQAALIEELKKGRINAALDVFDPEPLEEDSPLRDMPNCFVVPHRAGPTPDRRKVMGRHAVDNILAYVNGAELDGVVTVRKYDLMT